MQASVGIQQPRADAPDRGQGKGSHRIAVNIVGVSPSGHQSHGLVLTAVADAPGLRAAANTDLDLLQAA